MLFNPQNGNHDVYALFANNEYVYICSNDVKKVDSTNGEFDTTFNVNSNDADVYCIEPALNEMFIGGVFFNIGGISKNRVAKIDAATGNLNVIFDANMNYGSVCSLSFDNVNNYLFIGGTFDTIGGVPQKYCALVNGTTGELNTIFKPEPDNYINVIKVSSINPFNSPNIF